MNAAWDAAFTFRLGNMLSGYAVYGGNIARLRGFVFGCRKKKFFGATSIDSLLT
ncbi:hypothetical protein [Massilia sp. NR 4-1]|uniref:hypothetical protein n=1 Tax=Massilia sp. NR 4-1 TaxID=1678028 RepID=UPI001CBBEDBF|nr:hypothetical protein [Massilia sp. NR 4-1]